MIWLEWLPVRTAEDMGMCFKIPAGTYADTKSQYLRNFVQLFLST